MDQHKQWGIDESLEGGHKPEPREGGVGEQQRNQGSGRGEP